MLHFMTYWRKSGKKSLGAGNWNTPVNLQSQKKLPRSLKELLEVIVHNKPFSVEDLHYFWKETAKKIFTWKLKHLKDVRMLQKLVQQKRNRML